MIKFIEDQHIGYRHRTIENAKADATLAFAINFSSAGEVLTKNSVISQKKIYIPISLNPSKYSKEFIEDIVKIFNDNSVKTLNVAGNGLYTLKGFLTQYQCNEIVYRFLKEIINSPNLVNKIESIRSGGQSGVDLAGIIAAEKLGIDSTVLAPKFWKFRDKCGEDICDEKLFKERFKVIENRF